MKVAELMTPNPDTIGPEATLEEAARRILEKRYSSLPVVDREGCLLGLLQVEDLLPHPEHIPFSDVEALQLFGEWVDVNFLENIYRRYQKAPVKAVMRTDMPRIHPEDPVGRALEALLKGDIRHLPVVDQGNRVVGILTCSDFLKLILGRR
ncbi:CBS domain-containing protein [Thermus scotoductus]|uniref:Histidine kinase n=1 Tax=Thermus scotoductus TaxID=37636 RepID=A0A430QY44_THESC|nr:CBS domain-containing protein [Thermus scotoductus]RTG97475.1 histidine kinase [Thermus scotoductus]RTH00056.1 histidine kinase [Thermus scotoductus]RTH20618.1 histidine kinase [Thermus scotoductus]RTH22850.1 histidine kinase [Thermus scotoductus]RTH98357.1 histidine kinase [Thermus scotoductus]